MIERLLKFPLHYSFFLFGPRQTGKTTLLNLRFNSQYTRVYNLLLSREFQRFTQAPGLLTQEVMERPKNIKYVVIDEIQLVPGLLNEIHHILEQPHAPYFALSGSSARKLKREHANLLAGRALVCHLFPLTHIELGKEFKLGKALHRGTLPKVYFARTDELASDILQAYVDTYLEEEIKQEAITRRLDSFLKFLHLAADNNGQIINFSTVARECGVSYKLVQEYFQILQDTLVGFYLLPYSRSLRKRLVKHPKFYFFDTGVVRALKKLLAAPLAPKTYEFGRAFEHFIILELMRLSTYNKKQWEFSFYRSSNQAEVDLIIETPAKQIYAIEIKSSDYPEKEALSGLESFQSICPSARLYCVSTIPHRRKKHRVHILPWQDIFRELNLI